MVAMLSADEPFACTQCGECCKGFGGTYVTEQEIAAIAAYLDISAEDFVARYCVRSGGRPLLGQKPDGYCLFFAGNCSIHAVKPRMCRNWPYIDSLRVDIRNWQIMADTCPGMRLDMSDEQLRQAILTRLRLREDRTPPPKNGEKEPT
jgi:hypothetical protein